MSRNKGKGAIPERKKRPDRMGDAPVEKKLINFRISNEQKKAMKHFATDLDLNHTDLIIQALEFAKANVENFKKFIK